MRVELRVESRVELRVQLQSEGRIEGGIEGGIVLLFCVSPLPPPPVMVRKSQEARVYLQMFRLGGEGGGKKSRFKFGFHIYPCRALGILRICSEIF